MHLWKFAVLTLVAALAAPSWAANRFNPNPAPGSATYLTVESGDPATDLSWANTENCGAIVLNAWDLSADATVYSCPTGEVPSGGNCFTMESITAPGPASSLETSNLSTRLYVDIAGTGQFRAYCSADARGGEGGVGGFTPNANPEVDHSGFDTQVARGANLAPHLTPGNYTPTDLGDSGASLREHLAGIDAAVAGAGGGPHASTHSENQSDEVLVEDLGTGSLATGHGFVTDGAGGVTTEDITTQLEFSGHALDAEAHGTYAGSASAGGAATSAAALEAGALDALTEIAGALCGTNEILEDQGAGWACIATPAGGATTEAGLEAQLTDVTNVFTNNDGALTDDDLTDDVITDLSDVTAKSNPASTVVATAGAGFTGTNHCVQRNSSGDLVTTGAACGAGGTGTEVQVNTGGVLGGADFQNGTEVTFSESGGIVTAQVVDTALSLTESQISDLHTPPTASTLSGVGVGTDLTVDLEEEVHASEHLADAGPDELFAEALGTACTNGQVIKSDGDGTLSCAADNDSGGNPTGTTSATFTVDNDNVGPAVTGSGLLLSQDGTGLTFDSTLGEAGLWRALPGLSTPALNIEAPTTAGVPTVACLPENFTVDPTGHEYCLAIPGDMDLNPIQHFVIKGADGVARQPATNVHGLESIVYVKDTDQDGDYDEFDLEAAWEECAPAASDLSGQCIIQMPQGLIPINTGLDFGDGDRAHAGITLRGHGPGWVEEQPGQDDCRAGTRLVWNGTNSCTDQFDNVKGSAQTSGWPDGLCDSNGVTEADSVIKAYSLIRTRFENFCLDADGPNGRAATGLWLRAANESQGLGPGVPGSITRAFSLSNVMISGAASNNLLVGDASTPEGNQIDLLMFRDLGFEMCGQNCVRMNSGAALDVQFENPHFEDWGSNGLLASQGSAIIDGADFLSGPTTGLGPQTWAVTIEDTFKDFFIDKSFVELRNSCVDNYDNANTPQDGCVTPNGGCSDGFCDADGPGVTPATKSNGIRSTGTTRSQQTVITNTNFQLNDDPTERFAVKLEGHGGLLVMTGNEGGTGNDTGPTGPAEVLVNADGAAKRLMAEIEGNFWGGMKERVNPFNVSGTTNVVDSGVQMSRLSPLCLMRKGTTDDSFAFGKQGCISAALPSGVSTAHLFLDDPYTAGGTMGQKDTGERWLNHPNYMDVTWLTNPTLNGNGQMAFDEDGLGTNRDSLDWWDGVEQVEAVATVKSSVPSAGQVPTFQTGGTVTWETPAAGGSGDSVTINSPTDTATDVDFSDASPAAPAGGVNVRWQSTGDSPTSVSANVPISEIQQASCPTDSIPVAPGDDWPTVLAAHDAGTTYCALSGVHYAPEPITPGTKVTHLSNVQTRDKIMCQPGAIFSGTKPLTGAECMWNGTDGHWECTGQTQFIRADDDSPTLHCQVCADTSPEDGLCDSNTSIDVQICKEEELIWGDKRLKQIDYRSTDMPNLGDGEWAFDYSGNIIYIDPPDGITTNINDYWVRTTVASNMIQSAQNRAGGNHVDGLEVHDCVVEGYGTGATSDPEPSGAIIIEDSTDFVLKGVEFRFNHVNGFLLNSDTGTGSNPTLNGKLINVYSHHNGKSGGSIGRPYDVKVIDSTFAYNNEFSHFSIGAVGSGLKIGGDALGPLSITNSHFLFNVGKGLWIDGEPSNWTVSGGSSIGNNSGDGHEPSANSYGVMIERTCFGNINGMLIRENGAAGLRIAGSSNITATNNEIRHNGKSPYQTTGGGEIHIAESHPPFMLNWANYGVYTCPYVTTACVDNFNSPANGDPQTSGVPDNWCDDDIDTDPTNVDGARGTNGTPKRQLHLDDILIAGNMIEPLPISEHPVGPSGGDIGYAVAIEKSNDASWVFDTDEIVFRDNQYQFGALSVGEIQQNPGGEANPSRDPTSETEGPFFFNNGSGKEEYSLKTWRNFGYDNNDIKVVAEGGVGTTQSPSGMEWTGNGKNLSFLSLLQGCAEGEILKWNDSTNVWACQPDGGAGGSPFPQVRSMHWGAGAISISGGGITGPLQKTFNTTGPRTYVLQLNATGGVMYGNTMMPDGWDPATTVGFTFSAVNSNGAPSGTLTANFAAMCRTPGTDTIGSTWGTAVLATITFATQDRQERSNQVEVTPNTSCSAGDHLYWKADIAGSTAQWTNIDIFGAKMEYTASAAD